MPDDKKQGFSWDDEDKKQPAAGATATGTFEWGPEEKDFEQVKREAAARVAKPLQTEVEHIGKGYVTPEQERENQKRYGWYGPTVSALQRWGGGASNVVSNIGTGLKEVGGTIVGAAKDISSDRPLLFGEESGPKESTFHKYVIAPSERENEKAQHSDTALESIGHSVAAGLPLIGPAAASIGEQAGTGDVGGAAGRGVGQIAGLKTVKALTPDVSVNPSEVGKSIGEAVKTRSLEPIGKGVEVKAPPAVEGFNKIRQAAAEKIVSPLARKPPVATMKDLRFGVNPGRAIAGEGLVAGSREALVGKINDRVAELSDSLDKQLQNHPNSANEIDAEPMIDKAVDAGIKEARKTGSEAAITRLEALRTALKNEHGAIKGTPFDINNLKRSVGDAASSLGAFKATDPIESSAASVMADLYTDLKDAVNKEIPEGKPLNERIADLIGARTGVARNIALHINKSPFSVLGPSHAAAKALEATVGSTPVRTGAAYVLNLGNFEEGAPEVTTKAPQFSHAQPIGPRMPSHLQPIGPNLPTPAMGKFDVMQGPSRSGLWTPQVGEPPSLEWPEGRPQPATISRIGGTQMPLNLPPESAPLFNIEVPHPRGGAPAETSPMQRAIEPNKPQPLSPARRLAGTSEALAPIEMRGGFAKAAPKALEPVLKETGWEYGGKNSLGLHEFKEPGTNISITVKEADLTPEKVRERIAAKLKEFKR